MYQSHISQFNNNNNIFPHNMFVTRMYYLIFRISNIILKSHSKNNFPPNYFQVLVRNIS